MQSVETLPNSPITEAILDFKVTVPEDIGLQELAAFHAHIRADFPRKMPQIKIVQQVSFGIGKETKSLVSEKRTDGFRFTSEDGLTIVQVQKNRFSFHRLKPYLDWERFSKEGMELLECYCEHAKPISVERIGLRYLNRIELPQPFSDFRDFCLLFPETPPEVPQMWSNFFIRFSPYDQDTGSHGNVTLTIANDAQQVATRFVPIIFDIDVFFHFPPDRSRGDSARY